MNAGPWLSGIVDSRPVQRLFSLVVLLCLWQLVCLGVGERLLPSPVRVAETAWAAAEKGPLLTDLGATLARVGLCFALAMSLGTALGTVMGRRPVLDRLLDGWLLLFLNVPALVTIVLCYVWFGLVEAAAVAAVTVSKLPVVAVTVREGARSLSRDHLEMAAAFRFGPVKTLRHVILPELAPYLLASGRSGLSLVWKVVLVAELLGRSDGVGFRIHMFFQVFDIAGILAYTFAFVAVMGFVEVLVMRPLERRVARWRR